MPIQAQVEGLGTLEFPDGTDPSIVQSTVKQQLAAKQGQQPQGGGAMDTLKNFGSAAVRPLVQGATALPLMAADAGVEAGNLVNKGLSKMGVKTYPEHQLQDPSKTRDELLDKYTRKPDSKVGQLAEDAASMLVSGPQSAEEKAAAKIMGKAPTPREQKITVAHQAGFTLPPSETGASVGKAVESAAGKAAVEREASQANQKVTDRLAKIALGLDPEDHLDEAALERLKMPAYAAYEAVASTGTVKADEQYIKDVMEAGKKFTQAAEDFPGSVHPDIDKLKSSYLQDTFCARGAIDAMKQLRADAGKNLKNYDPEKNAIGLVQREISDALLSRLDRHAATAGDPTLINRFKEARTQLAKIQVVEDSMINGRVSASEIGKLYASRKGKGITGELGVIGLAANEFPKVFQNVGKMGESGPFSVVDLLVGGGTAAATHSWPLAAAVAARPLARAGLKSKAYQRISTQPKRPSAVPAVAKKQLPQAIAAGATSPDLGESQP